MAGYGLLPSDKERNHRPVVPGRDAPKRGMMRPGYGSVRVGVTAEVGRPSRANMTPPPPALTELDTGNRGTRRRAPVSDHPGLGSVRHRRCFPGFPEVFPTPCAPSRRAPTGGDTVLFAGIDWASKEHAVTVLDADTDRRYRTTIQHTAEGFDRLVAWLAGFGDPAALPVAIERPDGRLVDRLLETGYPVVPVKTNAIKEWREAEVISGAKTDPGDADVIADYLRVRHRSLRTLTPFSDQTRALRMAVRTRDDLVAQRVAATNQLAALLDAFWPGAKHVFADVASPIALAFLARYPTPAAAARLGEKRMAAFCKKHGYSGRRPASVLLERLRAAPPGVTDPAQTEAGRDAVLGLVRVLEGLNAAVKTLDRSVVARLGEHPDAEIFTSLPRSGQINAAQMLAEWGDCRQAYDGPDAVAALAGQTPVTKRSGKHQSVTFRWACNKRFRNAIDTFADNSRHASPWAASVYHNAIRRGHDHPHAVRILARAWIRVIYRCWHDHVPYDETLHGAARRLKETSLAA